MHTKEETIIELKKRIDLFKGSLKNPYSFDTILLNSASPKKDRIRLWGETLEKIMYLEGRHKQINTISTIITLELRELHLDKNIPYVRMVLPNKYKDVSQMRSKQLLADTINYSDNYYREHEQTDFSRENEIHIERYERTIAVILRYIEKLKQKPYMSKIDLIEYDEFATRFDSSTKMLEEILDDRDQVLPSKHHLFMAGYTIATKAHAFTKYLQYMRKVEKLTSKQASKLLGGRVNKVDILYEPRSLLEARHAGFVGKPCDECGSYRIDLKYNSDRAKDMHFCYSCRVWTERSIEKLVEKLI